MQPLLITCTLNHQEYLFYYTQFNISVKSWDSFTIQKIMCRDNMHTQITGSCTCTCTCTHVQTTNPQILVNLAEDTGSTGCNKSFDCLTLLWSKYPLYITTSKCHWHLFYWIQTYSWLSVYLIHIRTKKIFLGQSIFNPWNLPKKRPCSSCTEIRCSMSWNLKKLNVMIAIITIKWHKLNRFLHKLSELYNSWD